MNNDEILKNASEIEAVKLDCTILAHQIERIERMPIYWKEFEDGDSTNGNYIVMTLEDMLHQVNLWLDDFHEHNDRPPVFEPVRMSVAEFEAEQPFTGF